MEESCPVCQENGKTSRLVPFQINWDEAVILCEVANCTWPLESSNYTYIQRNFMENNKKISKKKSKHKSKQNTQLSGELLLYTPPATPKEENQAKEIGKGNLILDNSTTTGDNFIIEKSASDSYASAIVATNSFEKLDNGPNLDYDELEAYLSSVQVDELLFPTTDPTDVAVKVSPNNSVIDEYLNEVKVEPETEEKFSPIVPKEEIDKGFPEGENTSAMLLNNMAVSFENTSIVKSPSESDSKPLGAEGTRNRDGSDEKSELSMIETADVEQLIDHYVGNPDLNTTANFDGKFLEEFWCD